MPQYFPHLNHGIGSQYPIRRTTRFRTVVNANDLTTSLRATDPGARRVAWWLRYQGLSDGEVASLASLFRSVHGPLDSFTFLDPEDNLLSHSEALDEALWQKSAGLTVAPFGIGPDGTGEAFLLTSSPGQPAEIFQSVPAPASYRWLVSVYARSSAGGQLSLFVRSSTGEQAGTYSLSSEWKRYAFGGQFWSSGQGIEAGLRMGGGTSLEATAFQLETQLAPSRYKRTGEHSGVHPGARFSQDSLRVNTLANDCHQVNLIITAPLPG